MRKEIRIGILAIAALIVFFSGYNYLMNNDIFGSKLEYCAVYQDVKNLSESNPVRINGVKVGVVKDIKFPLAPGDNRVLVVLRLEKDIPIPEKSVAKIESDLLGSNMINLLLSKNDNYIEVGDTLNSAVASTIQEEVSLQMAPVKRKAENLMLQLDSVLEVVKYVFDEDARTNIAQSLSSIKKTIKNLEKTTSNLDIMVEREKTRLDVIIGNIESITTNLKNNEDNINNTLDNLSQISDTLALARIGSTFQELNQTVADLNKITGEINEGDGTLGKLVNNDTLYNKLNSSAENLDNLVEDIKLNPQRYLHFSVFGKKSDKKKSEYPETEEK